MPTTEPEANMVDAEVAHADVAHADAGAVHTVAADIDVAPAAESPRGHVTYDYAIVRVVPKVERGEFVNAGVIVSCPALDYLDARVELDERRLLALDPGADIEAIRDHLAAIPPICAGGEAAGPIGELPQRERFRWLVAPRSTMIQTSPVHTGTCADPAEVLLHLFSTVVR